MDTSRRDIKWADVFPVSPECGEGRKGLIFVVGIERSCGTVDCVSSFKGWVCAGIQFESRKRSLFIPSPLPANNYYGGEHLCCAVFPFIGVCMFNQVTPKGTTGRSTGGEKCCCRKYFTTDSKIGITGGGGDDGEFFLFPMGLV